MSNFSGRQRHPHSPPTTNHTSSTEAENVEVVNLMTYEDNPASWYNRRDDGDETGPFMDVVILTCHLFYDFYILVSGDMWPYLDPPARTNLHMESKLCLVGVAMKQ